MSSDDTNEAPIASFPDAAQSPELEDVGGEGGDEAWREAHSVGDVVRLAVGADTARLIAHDPVARLARDPEGVHQARVATRRLRSHLSTFDSVLRHAPTTKLSRELRRLGRTLGTVRDLDVLRERFEGSVEQFEPMVRNDGVHLLDVMDAERAVSYAALREMMSSARYRALLATMGAFVADPPLREAAGQPAEPYLLVAIRARYDALDEAVEALPATPSDPQLHEVRIIAKPARYAAELGAPILGAPCRRLSKRLADLCDELGLLNDGARANQWLDVAGEDPTLAFAVALIRAKEIDRMIEARAEWPRRWERVRIAAAEMGWGEAAQA
jgi:CHAD domain-containing protein